jgi:hypothetical protein
MDVPRTKAEERLTAFGSAEVESSEVFNVEVRSKQESNAMEAIGLFVTLEARRGKEADAEAFLKSAQPLALDEKGTLKWYAIKLGPGKFGIFDTFANEAAGMPT